MQCAGSPILGGRAVSRGKSALTRRARFLRANGFVRYFFGGNRTEIRRRGAARNHEKRTGRRRRKKKEKKAVEKIAEKELRVGFFFLFSSPETFRIRRSLNSCARFERITRVDLFHATRKPAGRTVQNVSQSKVGKVRTAWVEQGAEAVWAAWPVTKCPISSRVLSFSLRRYHTDMILLDSEFPASTLNNGPQ